ncbi:photoreceptor-specific nuclear receptor-like [Littorina saxatilis]|uniref:NR LBD domain-containing protein n=1 Tax=Littorina saxatilis TaxID=31220 RepID=A0AAN9AUC1_9CAEN
MEVLYRNQPLFGAQPAAMVYPSTNFSNLSTHMFASPPQAYSCYSFDASPSLRSPHTPSRTPTPEYPSKSMTNESSMSQGTTLKSVLRGEVPEAYSHFLSGHSEATRQPSPLLGKRKSPFVELEASHSPSLLSRGSSTVLSPPPEDVQTEPMDLSFKRPSSTSSGSSSPASFHHTFPPSPAEDNHHGQTSEFSLLRNLLQVGKVPQPSSSSYSPSTSSDRSCDSPCSDSGLPTRHMCGSTRVTLAKKNMYPVSARVSDWLLKVVQFANSIQVFREELNHNDRLTLILNSWSRLLLLFMAESNFQFAVTPLRTEPEASECEGGPSPDEPTMKSVEGVQTFIRKCQNMGVESDEYYYLRMLVLFNSSYVGLSEPSKVDSFNSQIQQSLQEHVQRTRQGDIMHYSRLLMCLPSLYGISAKMVEHLFCRHIDNNSATDMDVLLKELLQTWSTSSNAAPM